MKCLVHGLIALAFALPTAVAAEETVTIAAPDRSGRDLVPSGLDGRPRFLKMSDEAECALGAEVTNNYYERYGYNFDRTKCERLGKSKELLAEAARIKAEEAQEAAEEAAQAAEDAKNPKANVKKAWLSFGAGYFSAAGNQDSDTNEYGTSHKGLLLKTDDYLNIRSGRLVLDGKGSLNLVLGPSTSYENLPDRNTVGEDEGKGGWLNLQADLKVGSYLASHAGQNDHCTFLIGPKGSIELNSLAGGHQANMAQAGFGLAGGGECSGNGGNGIVKLLVGTDLVRYGSYKSMNLFRDEYGYVDGAEVKGLSALTGPLKAFDASLQLQTFGVNINIDGGRAVSNVSTDHYLKFDAQALIRSYADEYGNEEVGERRGISGGISLSIRDMKGKVSTEDGGMGEKQDVTLGLGLSGVIH